MQTKCRLDAQKGTEIEFITHIFYVILFSKHAQK